MNRRLARLGCLTISLFLAGFLARQAAARAQEHAGCFAVLSSGQVVDLNHLCAGNRQPGGGARAQAYRQGRGLSQAERHPEAIASFTQAIRVDANSADAYRDRAHSQVLAGNRVAAVADYEQAARLYRQQGKLAQASLLERMAAESRALLEQRARPRPLLQLAQPFVL